MPILLNDAERVRTLLADAKRILCICHRNPDGDAVGALLGMGLLLESVFPHIPVSLHCKDGVPDTFSFLPAEARVQALAAETAREAERLAGSSGGYDAPPWLYLHRVEKLIRLDYLARPLLGLALDDFAVSAKRTLLLSHHAAHELRLERLDFHLWEASCGELLRQSREALAASSSPSSTTSTKAK